MRLAFPALLPNLLQVRGGYAPQGEGCDCGARHLRHRFQRHRRKQQQQQQQQQELLCCFSSYHTTFGKVYSPLNATTIVHSCCCSFRFFIPSIACNRPEAMEFVSDVAKVLAMASTGGKDWEEATVEPTSGHCHHDRSSFDLILFLDCHHYSCLHLWPVLW